MIQYEYENEAANEAYDQLNQDIFQTDFETFPDRGPAMEGNTFGFRPMPAALEVVTLWFRQVENKSFQGSTWESARSRLPPIW